MNRQERRRHGERKNRKLQLASLIRVCQFCASRSNSMIRCFPGDVFDTLKRDSSAHKRINEWEYEIIDAYQPLTCEHCVVDFAMGFAFVESQDQHNRFPNGKFVVLPKEQARIVLEASPHIASEDVEAMLKVGHVFVGDGFILSDLGIDTADTGNRAQVNFEDPSNTPIALRAAASKEPLNEDKPETEPTEG
jgi:hypothetical protein